MAGSIGGPPHRNIDRMTSRMASVGMTRVMPIGLALIVVTAGIVWPLRALKPVPNVTEQRGYLLALRDACNAAGDDAAIVVLQGRTGLFAQWAPQTLRGWCDVPVAVMPTALPDRGAALTQLATQWKAAGRTLWVVADEADTIHSVLPTAAAHETPSIINPYFLGRTLVSRPEHYVAEEFSLALAPVPPG